MTLSNVDINRAMTQGSIEITPFKPELMQPASVDLRLGNEFLRFATNIDVTRPWEPQYLWEDATKVGEGEEFIVGPGEFVLGTTIERVGLARNMCAEVWGKSSLGRIGLSVHVTAGFIDPGFGGQITLEFYNVSPVPVALRPEMAICQVAFNELDTPATSGYSGKYSAQTGVTPGRYHENYR